MCVCVCVCVCVFAFASLFVHTILYGFTLVRKRVYIYIQCTVETHTK